MPTPCRWPALFTLSALAKFQLIWRRRCDAVLFPSCLVKHGLTDAPLRCTLYSSASFEGSTLSPFALPRFLPPYLPPLSSLARFLLPSLPHFLCPGSLPPSFPSSPPAVLDLPSGSSCKASGWYMIRFKYRVLTRLVHCQQQPRKSSYEGSPENYFHSF